MDIGHFDEVALTVTNAHTNSCSGQTHQLERDGSRPNARELNKIDIIKVDEGKV